MRHLLPISGKDSLATALVQIVREPDLPYEPFVNDVEAELPETYAWLDKVDAHLSEKIGKKLYRTNVSLPAKIRSYGGFLPGPKSRYCTKETKIAPMEEWLGKDEAIIYYGLRADEVRTGFIPVGKAKDRITPRYPLQELGIDIRGVYAILDAQDLAPPNFFWPRLYDEVCRRMTGWGDWESHLSRTEKDRLFSGRTRGNCYFCFFQQLPEWVWLMETHPDLWEQAKSYENVGSEYTWRQDYSLAEIEKRADKIFQEKARKTTNIIQKRLQFNVFETEDNEIAATSCGLLCGK